MLFDTDYDLQETLAKKKAIKDVKTLMNILAQALPELDKSIGELAGKDRDAAKAHYANEVRATAFRVHIAIAKEAAKQKFLSQMPEMGELDSAELRRAVERYGQELQRIGRLYRYL